MYNLFSLWLYSFSKEECFIPLPTVGWSKENEEAYKLGGVGLGSEVRIRGWAISSFSVEASSHPVPSSMPEPPFSVSAVPEPSTSLVNFSRK